MYLTSWFAVAFLVFFQSEVYILSADLKNHVYTYQYSDVDMVTRGVPAHSFRNWNIFCWTRFLSFKAYIIGLDSADNFINDLPDL